MVYTLHADLDAMFAALEQRDFPKYKGKPIAVVTGIRGPIAAASYEAKRYGVKSGMRVSDARKLCGDIIIVRGRPDLYQTESIRFKKICESYADKIFPYGVDEVWLDLNPWVISLEEAQDIGRILKTDIKNEIGITASVGISEDNRLLAKMASDLEKPDGLTTILLSDIEEKLYDLSVRDLFMVGPSTESDLRKLNVETIGDLAGLSLELLVLYFKPYRGRMLYNYSHGIVEPPIPSYAYSEEDRKSISHTQTLDADTRDFKVLNALMYILSFKVCKDLKAEDFYFTRLYTLARFEDFTDLQRFARFEIPSNELGKIYQNSRNALKYLLDIEPGKKKVRAIGVRATGMVRGENVRRIPDQLEFILS